MKGKLSMERYLELFIYARDVLKTYPPTHLLCRFIRTKIAIDQRIIIGAYMKEHMATGHCFALP